MYLFYFYLFIHILFIINIIIISIITFKYSGSTEPYTCPPINIRYIRFSEYSNTEIQKLNNYKYYNNV